MKSARKITRILLEQVKPDEYLFIGLVSSEPDYRLCLLINRELSISLRNNQSLRIIEKDRELIFNRFSSADNSLSLISNRAEKDILIKKLKKIDYIFITHDPARTIDADKLISDLRSVESVTAVFRIEPGSIKDKNFQYLIH
jgi:hypothetical protein